MEGINLEFLADNWGALPLIIVTWLVGRKALENGKELYAFYNHVNARMKRYD